MSIRLTLLNQWLRRVERPALVSLTDPERARRWFEFQARWTFHPPRGTTTEPTTLGGVPGLRVIPPGPSRPGTILYFHGGAYVFGSSRTHAAMLARVAIRTGLTAILPDYRLAPERPFPAALDDALAAYRALLDISENPIILGGDSAGGGLVLALLARIVALGLPQPVLTFALSPWTDLTLSGESLATNAGPEAFLPPERLPELRDMYLAGADPADPAASPLLANFRGATPIALWVGSSEILRDDSRRMVAQLQAEGVQAHLTEARDHPHVWPIFAPFLPESNTTLDEIASRIAVALT
jgi:acetyl esterase/lipase